MFIDFMTQRFEDAGDRDAIVWRDRVFSYQWLRNRVCEWLGGSDLRAVAAGNVVLVEADFSPDAIALMLALIELNTIIVPLTRERRQQFVEFLDISETEVVISIDADDAVTVTPTGRASRHSLYECLRRRGHPGLVLFSSGSTGQPKAAVHDFVPLLAKFEQKRRPFRTASFLLYDHIGGVNTLLYTLSTGGCAVTVTRRDPNAVLDIIDRYGVELLPTSPTFLNLILLSDAHRNHSLRSLRLITYGTEPMPETTLLRLREAIPGAELRQTYGLSETGILRTKSRSSDSLWVKIGGEGFETRVIDGVLHIKAASAMLGYLNAPSPFTEDGWMNTGDAVEVDGEYIKIRGRTSELINVGGEKVYPAEVESVIHEIAGIADVTVYGERNAITGQIVCAQVTTSNPIDTQARSAFVAAIRQHCRARLEPFKVPVRVALVAAAQHSGRFKKIRDGAFHS